MTVARIASINLECPDPAVLAAFWAAVLGGEVEVKTPNFWAVRTDSLHVGAVKVTNYRSPAWPSAERSQQLHLDLAVADLDTAEDEVLSLGATKETEQPSPAQPGPVPRPPRPGRPPFCLRT